MHMVHNSVQLPLTISCRSLPCTSERSPSDPVITREVDGTYSVALPTAGRDAANQLRQSFVSYAGAVVRAYKRVQT
jgi:hypothetical protein